MWCDLFVLNVGRFLSTNDIRAMACTASWHSWSLAGRASPPSPSVLRATPKGYPPHRNSEDKRQDYDCDRATVAEPPKRKRRSRTTEAGCVSSASVAPATAVPPALGDGLVAPVPVHEQQALETSYKRLRKLTPAAEAVAATSAADESREAV